MATAKLISAGNTSVVHTVTTVTATGTVKRLGESLVGRSMSRSTLASGSDGAFMTPQSDIWQLPHSVTTGSSGVIGDYAYFVGSGVNITSLSTGNGAPVGVFHKVTAQADTTCEIRMAAGGAAGDLAGVVDGFTMNEGADIEAGTTTGSNIGASASQKLALWGVTPVVQPAAAGQADQGAMTFAAGSIDTGVNMTAAEAAAIVTDLAALDVLLTAMRTAMVNAGIMKGAA